MAKTLNRHKAPALWCLLYDDDNNDNHPTTVNNKNHHVPKTTTTTTRTTMLLTAPPHVMALAGGWPQLYTAVADGANAIYLGLLSFLARARATNFDPDTELPNAVAYCHQHKVQVYVALVT
ncbi:hypothetical protein ACA910_018540 [Epithemia clementina (nom. ined.)]